MNRSSVPRMLSTSAALVVGCAAALAVSAPAHAAAFTAPYTCTTPLGVQQVTVEGDWTATPDPATVGEPVAVALDITSLGLTAPLTINSWSATTAIEVSGSETASAEVAGSGGTVPANQPITADLSGTWTPTAAGTAELRNGTVTIKADVFLLGAMTVVCTPNEPRPVLTVTVG
jgi:hypothetical protein